MLHRELELLRHGPLGIRVPQNGDDTLADQVLDCIQKLRLRDFIADPQPDDSLDGRGGGGGGGWTTPENIKVINPAFDMTPPELISGIITENGIAEPPYEDSIRDLLHTTI